MELDKTDLLAHLVIQCQMCYIVDMVLMLEEEEDTVDDWYVRQSWKKL